MNDSMRRDHGAAGHPADSERDEQENPVLPVRPGTPWGGLCGRVISLVSRKGGVGKTTSAVNLGAAFALSGHSVLLIGVDPQCGVSRSLGHGKFELDRGLLDVFQARVPLNHLAYPTDVENLRFVTPNIWTLDEEDEYKRFMETNADAFVQAVDRARDLYDTILIDCPPGMGPETRAALLASDSYLVPVQAEELCRDSLGRLLAFIQSFRDRIFAESNLDAAAASTAPPVLEGLFLTMVNARTRVGKHVADQVTEEHGLDLYETIVPRTTRLAEMALRGKPCVIYDRRSAGSRAYFDLIDEVVSRHAARRDEAESTREAPKAVPGNGGSRATGVEEFAFVAAAGGLSAVLRNALPTADPGAATDWESFLEENEPELVSLDELIEEEQEAPDPDAGEDWEEPRWSADCGLSRPN